MADTKYIEGIGRRKMAVARVRITPASKNSIVVNGKPLAEYFATEDLQSTASAALENAELEQKFDVSVKILGGGTASQAESVRLGIARALVTFDESTRPELKKAGFLKRDPRIKERKKFGLKKARKSPQWSKR